MSTADSKSMRATNSATIRRLKEELSQALAENAQALGDIEALQERARFSEKRLQGLMKALHFNADKSPEDLVVDAQAVVQWAGAGFAVSNILNVPTPTDAINAVRQLAAGATR